MRRSFRRIGTVLAVGAAIMTTAPAAGADVGPAHPRCPGWRVGVFVDPDYGGTGRCFDSGGVPNLGQFGLNNQLSSGWNHDTVPWCLYDGYNYTGWLAMLHPGVHYRQFAPSVDNRTSSIRRGAC